MKQGSMKNFLPFRKMAAEESDETNSRSFSLKKLLLGRSRFTCNPKISKAHSSARAFAQYSQSCSRKHWSWTRRLGLSKSRQRSERSFMRLVSGLRNLTLSTANSGSFSCVEGLCAPFTYTTFSFPFEATMSKLLVFFAIFSISLLFSINTVYSKDFKDLRSFYYHLQKAEESLKRASENPYAPRDLNYRKMLFDLEAVRVKVEHYLKRKSLPKIILDLPKADKFILGGDIEQDKSPTNH